MNKAKTVQVDRLLLDLRTVIEAVAAKHKFWEVRVHGSDGIARIEVIYQSELITQAEIQHRLVKIQDQLYMMDMALKAIATALANLRQESAIVPPDDPTRWEGQAQ